jgi:hypothetical protein
VFAIPYLFKSSPVAWEFARGELAHEMQQEMLEATGLRTVVWGENGFRNMTNSRREIKNPADMEGLKMRVMESPVFMRFMESLGAAATPISFSELVMSLQQGVVDGQENASSNVFENGMADVQKYFSTTEHIYSMTIITINDDVYRGLTPGQQQIVMEAGRLYASVANAFKVAADRGYVERIRDEKGLTVHVTTLEEKEQFRALAQAPVVEYVNEQLGKEFVDRVLGAVADAELVVINAHGITDANEPSAASLVLSPDPKLKGSYWLTADRVKKARLARSPVVILAACHAGRVQVSTEPWSLASSFLAAGARAVIAPTTEIPDQDANEVFESIIGRMQAGSSPEQAVAKEREERGGRSPWLANVVVFQ